MSTFSPGELVDGRYRIGRRLGTGGMADVYLAEDGQLERQVALKLLHRRFAEDPGFVERFRREAQSAANLQHPNVVAVYDRGSWDGTYYIAMEYLQGRTLKQVIQDEAPLDPVRAIDIALGMLKATRFAHRRGVIHRDLKPHNVMLDEQDYVKVTDFGIARAGASDMTETGSIMGTAQYLSPEQAQGLAVGEASDLYSIGVVLYEMLTGRVPFDAESAVTIALKHVSEAPQRPSTYNPQIPPALEQTVLWALNKNPADRPQDADAFIHVLESVRESLLSGGGGQVTASMAAVQVVGAAAGGPAPTVALDPRPHPRPIPSTELLPAADSGAFVPLGPSLAPPPPPDPDGRSRWGRTWPWLLLLLLLALVGAAIAAYALTRPHRATVPVVVNDSQSLATSKLESAGLNPNVISQPSQTRSGTVIYQSPLGGSRVAAGSTVDLTVSSGPGATTVPPVVQLSEKQAINQLHLAGLKVSRVLREFSSAVPRNEATRTDPAAGTSLSTGQRVVLYISKGVAPITVPSVTGDSLTTAQSALSRFTVKVIRQPTASTAPDTVLSQTPSGGTNALPGTTVTLTVAQKEPPVTVPNVSGDSPAAAEATLSGLGLKATTVPKRTTVKASNHKVIGQTPAPGTSVTPGSTVTLKVGSYTPPQTTTTATTTTATQTATTSTQTTSTAAGSSAPGSSAG